MMKIVGMYYCTNHIEAEEERVRISKTLEPNTAVILCYEDYERPWYDTLCQMVVAPNSGFGERSVPPTYQEFLKHKED